MGRPGILALQGGFEAHRKILLKLGYTPILVKTLEDLNKVNSLIIPGGESTVITKLLHRFGIFDFLIERIHQGLPVFGTCAGMILLSSGVENSNQSTLSVMDFIVRRNAYGRQKESFEIPLKWDGNQFSGLFIRAPEICCKGEKSTVLLSYNGKPVLLQQKKCMAASFHPELTGFKEIHRYFYEQINN